MSRTKMIDALGASPEAAARRQRGETADARNGDGRTEHRMADLAAVLHAASGTDPPWMRRLLARVRALAGTRTAPRALEGPAGAAAPTLATAKPDPSEAASHGHAMSVLRAHPKVLFTIASRNYRPYVRTLMASARAHHPDFARCLLLVDEPEEGDDVDQDLYATVHARALGLSSFDDMALRYDVLELNTALKPFFIDWLFSQFGVDTAVYLDPDIRVHAPLQRALAALDGGATVVLTPHVTQPLPADDALPDDHQFLRTGVFNLGFIALRRDPESLAFVRWWAEHLRTDCRVDFQNNLFTDQRWCDLAPCLLSRLHVLRDTACNVAYWNLPHRRLDRAPDGSWTVDDRPLVFFHFSGIDPGRPQVLSRHQNRLGWNDCPEAEALFADYREDLARHGWPLKGNRPYSYGMHDGAPIPAFLRRLYGHRHPTPRSGVRSAELLDQLLDECVPATPSQGAREDGLSELTRAVHRERTDVSRAFDLATPGGIDLYIKWFYAAGVFELELDATLLRWARRRGLSPVGDGA